MTGYLLDTHIFLWWLDDPTLIGDDARAAIVDGDSRVFVSAASVAEIAIKMAIGKLRAEGLHPGRVGECRFRELSVTHAHAWAMRGLPLIHRDPFDRMLVAQCQSEGLTLVTHDRVLAGYGIQVLAA